jgi:DNA/RNA-binding domain of Phe-tRNA-synthetase-like protein
MTEIELTVAEELEHQLLLGVISVAPVEIGPASADLLAEIERVALGLRSEFTGRAPAEIEGLRPARDLYKLFGVDPTKTRPSSEALLRRVLRGKPLPRILNAVDLCNLFALQFLLPLGLYDVAKIRGPVRLRSGEPEEAFAGIRKDQVHVAGRPVLADRDGAFGNPTSDSLRTSVDHSTRELWMVIFAPATFSRERMEDNVDSAVAAMMRYLVPPGAMGHAEGKILG